MGQGRPQFSSRVSVALLSVWLCTSCALPRIIALDDTLTAEQHNDLGYVYEKKGIRDLAEKEYLLALKKKEDWHVPYFNLGNLAFMTGDYERSEEFFRSALRYSQNDPDIMNNLANALLMQRRHQEARRLIEEAIQINRKDEYLDTLRHIREQEAGSSENHP